MTSPDKPVFVHSIGGSVSPDLLNKNPGFMTLDLDSETLLPINKNSYYFDIDKANSEGTPTWENHDYLKTFKMKDLSPSGFRDLADRIRTDKELAA